MLCVNSSRATPGRAKPIAALPSRDESTLRGVGQLCQRVVSKPQSGQTLLAEPS